MRPQSGTAANAVTPSSMSIASRTAKTGQLYRERHSGGFGSVEETDIGRCVWIEDKWRIRRWGAISFNSSSHLPPIEFSKLANPVRFLPGRAKLVTKPLPTGSPTRANTTGMVRVSC